MYKSVLNINKLRINIHLGWSRDERETRQDVDVYIKFFFNRLPKACITDNLEETICYDKLAKQITSYTEAKQFKLIEALCYQLYNLIRQTTSNETKIWIKVIKCNPPIENILGSTSFVLSDLE
jgi:dihydroneopterin aldolase